MHMVTKKDLNSAELETMRISRNPTTVMTANGEVQVRTMGLHTTGAVVKNHISPTMANYVPFVVCRRVPLHHPNTENPVTERSGSTSEELRRNPLRESTETENTNKNDGHEEVQSDLLHDLPDWLREFTEFLVDESSFFLSATEKPCAEGSRHFQFFS